MATRAEAHYSAGGPGRRAQGRLGRVLPGSGLGPAPVSWESSGLHTGVWAKRRVMGGVAGAVLAGGPVGPGGRRPSWAGDVLAPLWGCPGSWRPGEGLWVSQACTRPRTPGGQRACAWRRDVARGRVTLGRGADRGVGEQTVAQRARPEGHWEAGAGAGGALLVRALGGGQGHPQGHSGEDRAAGPRGPGCGPRRSVTGFSPHRPREAGDSLRHLPEGGHQNRQPGEAQRVCADEGERGAGPGGPGRGLGCGEARLGGPSVAMPAPPLHGSVTSTWAGPGSSLGL